MIDPRITHAIRINGRRVPVRAALLSAAWANVTAVPTRYDNTYRLLVGTRRVSVHRLEPLKPYDNLWWQPAILPTATAGIRGPALRRVRLDLSVAPVAPISGERMRRRINKALAIAQLKNEEPKLSVSEVVSKDMGKGDDNA